MARLELKTSGRQFRQFLTAIRRSLIRALTEFITNRDDSYRRLESAGRDASGEIQVIQDRPKRRLAGIDFAQSMDARDMVEMYPGAGSLGRPAEDTRERGSHVQQQQPHRSTSFTLNLPGRRLAERRQVCCP